MLSRVVVYVLLHLVAAATGWVLASWPGVAAGWVLAGLAWFFWDAYQASRTVDWLRRAAPDDVPGLGGIWRDLVELSRRQFRARDAITAAADRRLSEFLAAIQASPNGVVLLDKLGRIEWCNQTAAQHFGFDVQRDLQQHIGNLVRDPVFMAYFAGAKFDHPVTMPGRESNSARPVRLSVQIHPYGEGRKLLLSNDVTALEQAEAMRRDFVANVSHEIRTPLTVLSGFVETLQNLPLTADERARYLALMAQQSHRMQSLVSDLLTLSRLEGSPLPGTGEWISVATLMAQCEQEGRALAATLHLEGLGVQFDAGVPCSVSGIHSELLSAWSNLVNNAIRYTPAGGHVEVAWVVKPDGSGEFSVHDSGPGIAPEHLSRLTERFYRVDRSRSRDTGGTGLGLAIVKHVVQRHSAELLIQSTPGKGSRFAVLWPAERVQPQRERLAA